MNSRSGFTLLELLVVVGILAALVALALPYYQDYVNQSRITASQADLTTFAKALAAYDQLEPTMFQAGDLLPLIGRYTQDYRTYPAQTMPRDAWGRDYRVTASWGTVLSNGPNGNTDTIVATRVAALDDLIITWKPPFYLMNARYINPTTVDVYFSRKVNGTPPFGSFTFTGGITSSAIRKISDSQFRITVSTIPPGGPYTVTAANDGTVPSQDGRDRFDENPGTGAATGNTAQFP